MAEIRYGRQTPTLAAVLPYEKTLGGAAVELYQESGTEVLPWQKLVVYDMLAVNSAGEWIHTQ